MYYQISPLFVTLTLKKIKFYDEIVLRGCDGKDLEFSERKSVC
jgi:hypothetical protein